MRSAAFIIATKDRPFELRRLLKSIECQSVQPKKIIIVDAGKAPLTDLPGEFSSLPISHEVFPFPPSAAKQRNAGLASVPEDVSLIGFIDDDAVFEPDAFFEMELFWKRAHPSSAGAAFNLINHPPLEAAFFKSLKITEAFGFYSSIKGTVLRNGFQTMIGTVEEDRQVKWLPSGAVVWKKEVFEAWRFDEWFSGYSYLEDLDFSYSVGKNRGLYVVARARYRHLPSPQGRMDPFLFGRKEISHRLYFVRKNPELSLFKCYQTLLLRTALSLGLAVRTGNPNFLKRAYGNILAILSSLRPHRSFPKSP